MAQEPQDDGRWPDDNDDNNNKDNNKENRELGDGEQGGKKSVARKEGSLVVNAEMVLLDVIMSTMSPKRAEMASRTAEMDKTRVPKKARRVLGMDDEVSPETKRAMDQTRRRRIREQKRALDEVAGARPTLAQLAIPNTDFRVSDKALRILGDENLAQASCKLVTPAERQLAAQHPKVIHVLGDSTLASPKAQQRCGTEMDAKQRRAQVADNVRQAAARDEEARRKLDAVLRALPCDEQLELPQAAVGQPIPEKALRFFGEDQLETLSRCAVTKDVRKNLRPKTLHMLGDTNLLSRKERQVLGSLDANKPSSERDQPWHSRIVSSLRALGVM
ncbi:Hypothetical Protein FCC1311_091442 [Hondaea fermentalgiana]|uniref:Uncharacterized protein n=1 Tax=Hondaea fermentalgiana TaxID=2315210 RepID=A0A2R5GT32_9STRA|nr:Hypothetical Protein FCC1311_091442 [Hondaea fermentalgiana]|eukprot:GBG32918.1 Hypothetical Protein FCC1311_091442 [Hondaea fermentalgiana]